MSKRVQTDICLTDTAVSLRGVTKTFIQWQRETTGKSILQNLIKPEKKILTALDDVSFEIRRGEFVAYAGPNGAGKSTTMKLLGGMLLPTSGDISVLSLSPQKERVALITGSESCSATAPSFGGIIRLFRALSGKRSCGISRMNYIVKILLW